MAAGGCGGGFPDDVHSISSGVFKQLYRYDPIDNNDIDAYPQAKAAMEMQIVNHPLFEEEFNGPKPCESCGGRTAGSGSCYPYNCLTFKQGFECTVLCHDGTCGNRRLSDDNYMDVMRVAGSTVCKKLGLIARKQVEANSVVGEFVGVLKVGDRLENEYCIPIGERFDEGGDQPLLYLDASKRGNVARYIQTSCDTNCEFVTLICDKEYKVAIIATKRIYEGDELFVQKPEQLGIEIKCACGKGNCPFRQSTSSGARLGIYRPDLRINRRLIPNWHRFEGLGSIARIPEAGNFAARRTVSDPIPLEAWREDPIL